MNKIVLIIGFGSIGKQHYKSLINSKKFKKIYIMSKHYKGKNTINDLREIFKINPSIIIICSNTSDHFNQLSFLEKNFKDKIILVEKPLFQKTKNLKIKNNKVYVGYNLRYKEMLQYVKNLLKKRKVLFANINCYSYLPR